MSTNIGSFKLIAKRRSSNKIKLVCVFVFRSVQQREYSSSQNTIVIIVGPIFQGGKCD